MENIKLLDFNEIKDFIEVKNQYFGGIKSIPLTSIVGTVGRYEKFFKYFTKKSVDKSLRFKKVKELYNKTGTFSPIKVYEVDERYFIIDGHHRVAYLMKETDVKFIDANVVSLNIEIKNKEFDITDDILKKFLIEIERKKFEKHTGLFSETLKYPINLTDTSAYDKLYNELKDFYHEFLADENNKEFKDFGINYSNHIWYKDRYLPLLKLIRAEKIVDYFPNRTESDLYLWISIHKYYLSEKAGKSIDFKSSTTDFVDKYGNDNSINKLKKILKKVIKW